MNVPAEVAQVTPWPPSFCTVAVIFSVCPEVKPPRCGVSVTLTPGPAGVMVIVAVSDLLLSATEVARNEMAAGIGTVAGAVKMTGLPDSLVIGDIVPHAPALQDAPRIVQVTPLFVVSFCNVAVRLCVALTATLEVSGATVTIIGAGAGVIVIVAEADLVVSATEVAVIVTVAGVGTAPGAV